MTRTSARRTVVVAAVAAMAVVVPTTTASAAREALPQLAYAAPYSIDIVRADGSGAREVVDGRWPGHVHGPAWSPDGRELAFVHNSGRPSALTSELRRVNVRTGRQRTVITIHAIVGSPAWSPDGRRLAFVASSGWALSYACGCGAGWSDIFVVNRDGSGLAPVTADVAAESSPAWSPDGSHLAFSSDGVVYVVDPTVPIVRTRISPPDVLAWGPQWSPDGRRLAFIGRHVDHADGSVARPWVARADGSGTRPLPLRSDTLDSLSWSPDGRWLAADRDGIAVVRVRDGAIRQLTRGADEAPAWSPAGDQIAFVRGTDDGAPSMLYSVSPSGGAAEPFTTCRPFLDGHPCIPHHLPGTGPLVWTSR